MRPLLVSGDWVLLDRFIDSSLAYQGAARGLGVDEVAAINAFGTGGLTADRTLLLRIDPAAGRARQEGRDDEPDRLEREADAFFDRDRRRLRRAGSRAPRTDRRDRCRPRRPTRCSPRGSPRSRIYCSESA